MRTLRFKQLQKAYKLNGPIIWCEYDDVATYPDVYFDYDDLASSLLPDVEYDEVVYIF